MLGEPKPGPYGRRGNHAEEALMDEHQLDTDSRLSRRSARLAGSGSAGASAPGMLSSLITNPVVIGVVAMSACAIGYELYARSGR